MAGCAPPVAQTLTVVLLLAGLVAPESLSLLFRNSVRVQRAIRHQYQQRRHPVVGPMQSEQASGSSSGEMQQLKQLVINAQNKIVDFERGRHMDANDEAVQQLALGPADNNTLQGYVQRNCTSCLMREEAKLGRIERIKEDLLQKLGFKQAPNATGKDMPPLVPHLQGLLLKWGFNADNTLSSENMLADEARRIDLRPDSYEAQTERVYAFATKPPAFLGIVNDTDVAYFRLSADAISNNVQRAFLHVYIRPSASATVAGVAAAAVPLKLQVYTLDHVNGKKSMVDTKEFKRSPHASAGHWEKVEVTSQVQHWFQKPEKNYGLVVRAELAGENLVNLPESHEIRGENQLYLDIVTRESARSRSKRSVAKLDCQEKDNDTRCCRYPLVIDFESFGWDWVIAPKKYLAYYCSGECPFQHLQRYMHTHLVQQANPRGNVGPCCYPTQVAPIPMIYYNDNKEVHVTKVPGMVVARCGCA